LPRFASRIEQSIEFQSLLGREIGGERGVGFASCPGATGERQAFDHGQSWNYDPAAANLSNEQGDQRHAVVGAAGLLSEPGR
jgi:hypothetical protein